MIFNITKKQNIFFNKNIILKKEVKENIIFFNDDKINFDPVFFNFINLLMEKEIINETSIYINSQHNNINTHLFFSILDYYNAINKSCSINLHLLETSEWFSTTSFINKKESHFIYNYLKNKHTVLITNTLSLLHLSQKNEVIKQIF
jgi:hypothetical protein